MKTCNKCRETKPLKDFHKHRSNNDGLAGSCRECSNAKTRAQKAANKERDAQDGIQLVKVTVKCYNHGDGCKETRRVTIQKGDKPPRIVCEDCRTSGTPSERQFGLEAYRKKGGNKTSGHLPNDDWGGSVSVYPSGGSMAGAKDGIW